MTDIDTDIDAEKIAELREQWGTCWGTCPYAPEPCTCESAVVSSLLDEIERLQASPSRSHTLVGEQCKEAEQRGYLRGTELAPEVKEAEQRGFSQGLAAAAGVVLSEFAPRAEFAPYFRGWREPDARLLRDEFRQLASEAEKKELNA